LEKYYLLIKNLKKVRLFNFKRFNKKNKTLIQNFSSLSILQLSQYAFPLITFPYLVRVLGPDGYGLVAFANAFVMYFTILTDYGFNLSATKEISIYRDDTKKISEIYSSVLSVRLILFIISIILILPIVFLIPKFSKDANVYLMSSISVFGTTIFPVWFFQGVEKMKFITIISVIVKAIWVALVFLFVTTKSDLLNLVILNSASSVLIGIISLFVIRSKFNIKYNFPKFNCIKKQFVEGWHYFLSTASISLYTTSTTFILGLFASEAVVGYFSAADKIRYAVQNITSSASRTVFPHLALEFSKSKETAFKFLRKYFKLLGTIMVFISGALFLLSEQIVLVLLGNDYLESILILKILSFSPIVIFLSNVAGVQTMLNMGYEKQFSRIIFVGAVFSVITSIIIVPTYLEIGTAIIVVLTEILVTTQMFYFLNRKKVNIFKKIIT